MIPDLPVGVAISTTGEQHRLGLLVKSAAYWDMCLPEGSPPPFVTVDGSHMEFRAVAEALTGITKHVYRVGKHETNPWTGRQGVAVNKNVGLELLMSQPVAHLFLSDDDTWPRLPQSLRKHIDLDIPHTMLAWGAHRQPEVSKTRGGVDYAHWVWPRGSMLYTHRAVIEDVGGMLEAFGPGGHEHVEWSRRIHQAGWTPAPYCTPVSYMLIGQNCLDAYRADVLWHAEDMQRIGESVPALRARRRRLTSVRRMDGDAARAEQIMRFRDGNTDFVPYRAADNGRASATLYPSITHAG